MNSSLRFLFILLIVTCFCGCAKDKLVDDLAVFKGRYTWSYSKYKKHIFSSSLTTRQASNSNYTAEIEFTDKGRIIFYINGEKIHKTAYCIENQEVINNGTTFTLEIDPRNENSKKLDLNDVVRFTLTNDTLSNNNFPGTSYDNTLSGTHYFLRN